MRETLRHGVQVVTANQLFPTRPELAQRMVELAEIDARSTTCWNPAPTRETTEGKTPEAVAERRSFGEFWIVSVKKK
jgi:hypothetical protein